MRRNIQFKKLNKAFTSMCIIGLLLACNLGSLAEVKAETPSYTQQQTDIVWNKLSKTAAAGATIGSAGTTSYYYVESNTSYDASSKAAGTSGLIIKGTVYLFIPSGVSLNCTGAAGDGTTPGGAGIEVSEGNSLYILGAGALSATGGKAGDGGNGENGGSASATSITKGAGGKATLNSGYGGAGGSGGGGAGAGIGTKGANGVSGGARLAGRSQAIVDATSGVYVNSTMANDGKNSTPSANAGNIYKSATIILNAKGGTVGAGGKAGTPGKGWLDCGSGFKWYYSIGAGGSGAGGGSGYAAAAIGNGGASGAGGGSGVNGGICGSASVSYCLRNGQGGTGGVGGNDGANGTYQTSKANTVGFTTCSGGVNDAANNKLTIECWGRLPNGTISHGTVVGGRSGAAGVAGSSTVPTETSYNYSVKFLDPEGEIVAQTDYLFAEKTITAPIYDPEDKPVRLSGWKLVNYGNTLSDSTDPLTTAEAELYQASEKIQLSKLTYGNITLQAITEIDNEKGFDILNKSNFSSEPLNNMVENTTGGGLAQRVYGADPTSTLKVILINEADRVNLYKIADVSWVVEELAYKNVTWDAKVAEWLSHSAYAATDIATNPLAISDMTSNLKSEFFSSLFSKDDGAIKDMTPTLVDADASIHASLAEDGTYFTSFENVPAGMYAVVAEDSYSPVVISIFPYQNGPVQSWYLDSEYVAKLKHSDVDVNKWINENDISSTVAYKDSVSFDIDFKFPSLSTDYTDRVTLKGDGADTSLDYKLYAVDTMSPAFSLINTSANKPTITYSIKGTVDKELPATVDYYEFADETYTGSGEKEIINRENYRTYLYNDDYLLDNFGGITLYAVSKSAPIYTIGEPETSEDGTTTLSITFNAHALKAFVKDKGINMKEFALKLHYQATVTDKLEIGSDDNTNEIVLHYEEIPFKTTKIMDVVYGYSYGLQVIKIDGTESTDESKIYLPGVLFKLYKEVETKPEDMTEVYTYEDNGVNRYFVAVPNIFTESAAKIDEYGVFESVDDEKGTILKGLKEGKYILVETQARFGYNSLAEDIYFEINKLGDEEVANHYGGRYKVFKEKDFEKEEQIYNETGMVSISVLNYKGLSLPSTGGIGTLIFTIIGIIMMISVIIILIVKKGSRSSTCYM